MKRTRLFRPAALALSVLLLALAALAGGTLAGCKAQRPVTPRVEPPGLPIVLQTMTIRTESFSTDSVPEAYRASDPREGRAYFLVHMTDTIRSSWLQVLGNMDLRIAGYLAYNTLIIGMTPSVRDEVNKLAFVKWTGLYQPYFKLGPDIQALGLASPQPQVDVIVFDPAMVAQATQEIAALGMPVLAASADTWRGKLRIVLDPVLLPKLAALPEIEWIEPAAISVTGAQPGQETIYAGFPFSLYEAFTGAYPQESQVYDMGAVPWAPGTAQTYMAAAAEADRFAWDYKDWLAIMPSGSQGADSNGDGIYDAGTMQPAGAAKNALVAGSSSSTGAGYVVASYSGRGPAADGRIKPDLVGGGDPTSSLANILAPLPQTLASQFGVPSPSSALLRAVLANAGVAIGSGDGDAAPVPNSSQGWGAILPGFNLGLNRMLKVLDNTDGIGTGETRTYKVDAAGPGELRVTLAWTDYPSVPESGLNLVNDLDLRVIGPGNTYYYPNGRASRDPLNNTERVIVPLAEQPGEYTIEITAANVPFGPQPFALVVAQF